MGLRKGEARTGAFQKEANSTLNSMEDRGDKTDAMPVDILIPLE